MSKSFDVDDFVDAALLTASSEFGKEHCYVAAEHCQFVIPIKPLSLCWLIEANGWPLGRVTQSGGQFGTHKSSFIFQLIAWYLQAGGFGGLIDTENKVSASLMRSMIPPEYMDPTNPLSKRFMIMNAGSVQDWQKLMTEQHKKLVELSNKVKSKPSFPILWAVDSMMGSDSEGNVATINEEGSAPTRGYPEAAMSINRYFKVFPDRLTGWPITLHLSHHEKPGMNTMGVTRQGGKAPDFYATLDIQFKRGGVTQFGKSMEYDNIKSKQTQMKAITLEVRKSSMGSDIGKKLPILFCWEFNEAGEQRSWWDWSGSTAMLLKNSANSKGMIGEIMDVQSESKRATAHTVGGEWFWSDTLGIAKADALPASDFGKLVEEHPEIRPQLDVFFRIHQHPLISDMDLTV